MVHFKIWELLIDVELPRFNANGDHKLSVDNKAAETRVRIVVRCEGTTPKVDTDGLAIFSRCFFVASQQVMLLCVNMTEETKANYVLEAVHESLESLCPSINA